MKIWIWVFSLQISAFHACIRLKMHNLSFFLPKFQLLVLGTFDRIFLHQALELATMGCHKKFQLKRTNGFRVMAVQSFRKNGVYRPFSQKSFFLVRQIFMISDKKICKWDYELSISVKKLILNQLYLPFLNNTTKIAFFWGYKSGYQ